MTNGLLVLIGLVIPLLVYLLPILLLVVFLRWRRRVRARRNSGSSPTATPPVGAPAPVGDATAIPQDQQPAKVAPAQTAPVAPPKDPLWDTILGVVVFGFVFIKLGIAAVTWLTPDFRMLPPSMPKLTSELPNYVEVKGLKNNATTGALTGSAVIVDKDKATLHPLMRGLPKSIKATSPEEVDFVIWIDSERVPDPDSQITASAKPTPEQMAQWTSQGHPAGSGIPVETATVPTYKAKWTVTVIDLKKKEIRSTHSFVGPDLPAGEIDFRSPPLSGQQCLYVDDKLAKGAEVIFGEDGDVFIGGKPLAGVVAPAPWDEALEWIEQLIRPQ